MTPYADLRARLAPNADRMRAYALSESDPILADLLVTSADDIDALLARGEAAEADADRWERAYRLAIRDHRDDGRGREFTL